MAEVAGLVIGAAALAGLFSNCIDAFDLIQTARNQDRDLELLYQKLDNQHARFYLWGDTYVATGSLDGANPKLCQTIGRNMQHICSMLREGTTLATRYGMAAERDNVLSGTAIGITRPDERRCRPLAKFFWRNQQRLLQRLGQTADDASTLKGDQKHRVQWLVVDREKFKQLVTDLRELIDDLESLTSSMVAAHTASDMLRNPAFDNLLDPRRAIHDLQDCLEQMKEPDLELIAGADEDHPNVVSDAASSRLEVLSVRSRGSLRYASSRSGYAQSGRSTYYSARSLLESGSALEGPTIPEEPAAVQSTSDLNDICGPLSQRSLLQNPKRQSTVDSDRGQRRYELHCRDEDNFLPQESPLLPVASDRDGTIGSKREHAAFATPEMRTNGSAEANETFARILAHDSRYWASVYSQTHLTHVLSKQKARQSLMHGNIFSSCRPEGVSFFPIGDQYEEMFVSVAGSAYSPYAGGVFFFSLDLRTEARFFCWPSKHLSADAVRVLTPIFTPDVATNRIAPESFHSDSSGQDILCDLRKLLSGESTIPRLRHDHNRSDVTAYLDARAAFRRRAIQETQRWAVDVLPPYELLEKPGACITREIVDEMFKGIPHKCDTLDAYKKLLATEFEGVEFWDCRTDSRNSKAGITVGIGR